jgi:hypothetical protein
MTALTGQDREHLGILAIAHYALAGVTALVACIPLVHVVVFGLFGLAAASSTATSGSSPPPGAAIPVVFALLMMALPLMFVLLGWALAVAVFLNGRFLVRREHYMFCLVVSCVECIFMPLGTVLGVFTLLVLARESVKDAFNFTWS